MRKRVAKGEVPAEAALAKAWSALPEGTTLTTLEGDPVRVRYPGHSAGSAGPDFVDAVLDTARGELRGAVELHRRTSDWQRHGHGADPRYDDVVLHVVGEHDGAPSRTPGGVQLPLIELGAAGATAAPPGAPRRAFPCAPERAPRQAAVAAVAAAGSARFQANVERLRARLAHHGGAGGADPDSGLVEQVLYEEVAAALGYSRNEQAMRDLAAAVPLAHVAARRVTTGGPQLRVEALLLGAAGLLPSGRHLPAGRRRDAYVEALERAWQSESRAPALRAYRWDHAGARPENGPVRRVVGLAHLALRWPEGGLAAAIVERLRRGTGAHRALAALVAVPCPVGYWLTHWDAGVAAKGAAGGAVEQRAGNETAALIGPSRAADVVVNVLLPFAAAWGERAGDSAVAAAARACYDEHPLLAENWITRLVRERTALPPGPGDRVANARRQQGLIAVYLDTCRDLRCERCALSGYSPSSAETASPRSRPASRPRRSRVASSASV